ncbi:MAG: phosphatidylinositol-specific phospholipase C, partial [Flammeovirgaceae bacterium]|nr:phosphatidylinositol-specific phospholipase C [Flammeovirgaceae bacterium]
MKLQFFPIAVFLIFLAIFSCQENTIEPILEDKLSDEKTRKSSVSYTLSDWMGAINGSLKLSEFSIPGTHDSGARFDHALLSGTAKCQDLTIGDQLEAGTRFLDVRCRHYNNTFTIHHGVVYQNMNFDDVLNFCYGFLNNNPTETIIMSVKEEHTPENNNRSFEATFDSYMQANPGKWYVSETMPVLNSVRGKIVLLRRFSANSTPKGINGTAWQDDTTFEMNTTSGIIKIQD